MNLGQTTLRQLCAGRLPSTRPQSSGPPPPLPWLVMLGARRSLGHPSRRRPSRSLNQNRVQRPGRRLSRTRAVDARGAAADAGAAAAATVEEEAAKGTELWRTPMCRHCGVRFFRD